MIWYTLAYWLILVIAIVASVWSFGLLFDAADYSDKKKALKGLGFMLLAITLWWAVWVIYPFTALAG